MNFSELFIRRPIMTSLVMLAILLFGVIGYRNLAVSDLPNVDFPTIQVSAGLPGANPETMASSVATPLEKQFTTIAGLDSMTSTSSLGNTRITLQFDLSRNIDSAAVDVQTAMSAAAKQLPSNLPSPPTFRKVNPADQAIFGLAVTSPTLPLYEVDKYAENLIAEQMSEVAGVAQVTVNGAAKYAVRVELNPEALASRQIGIDEVEQAIQSANVNMPMGTLFGAHKAYNIESNGQLSDAAVFRSFIVAYRHGAPVRLDQVATVSDGVQDQYIADWVNGIPGIMLSVQRQPGTNTVEIVNNLRKLIPRFYAMMPPSINLSVEYDRSVPIRSSVNDVQFTLLLAVCLVILVIFLFLRNISATIMPSVALPMSIVGTFAVMYLLGYTIDTLSLLALTLSVGFVVDDAIVMLENIVRHMEMKKSALDAALDGSREVSFTILAMTLSLAVVFLPVFFMPGVFGRLLHEFAVVIISTVLVSGLVSITLTPMLCNRYLRPEGEKKHGWMYLKLEGMLEGSLHWYGSTLRWALRHRALVMIFGLFVLVGTGWEFWSIPKGFLPEEDTSQIAVSTEASQGISFDAMKLHQEAVNSILQADPSVIQFYSTISASSTTGLNNGRAFLHLKDPSDRPWTDSPFYDRLVALNSGHFAIFDYLTRLVRPLFEHHMGIEDIIHELRPKLEKVPGLLVFLQNPPAIRIGGQLTKSLYQFTLSSPDINQLYKYSQMFQAKLGTLPGLDGVTSDLQIKNPQANVVVDRDKASALGVTPQEVEDALYSAYGQRLVSPIYTANNEYWVVMQVQNRFQADPNMLSELYIRSSTGRLVPLSAVSKFTTNVGPLTVNHTGQLPSVTVSFNLAPGTALGQAVSEVQALAKSMLPISIETSFQGTAQAFQQSLTGLGILLIMTVLVIYIVLGILYESYIHPITILTGLPAAAFGGLATLSLFHMQLDIFGFVGLIMLIGIVKKNAIMMVDFALEYERKENCAAAESAYQGCMVRFRPIMMTSACTIIGTLPIAIGFGADADARRPLGLCVVGGLIFAQVVTLYLTPVFYTYMDAILKSRYVGKRRATPERAEQMSLLAPEAKHVSQD
ncbi:MAG TPA: efflux RND transporter permease subunit [Candidatus Dormibacteraeota bacterium]|nr:efflux RND transporter permease subunit [Candidatus Dormibacteraeota bacterium]